MPNMQHVAGRVGQALHLARDEIGDTAGEDSQ